jgi:hypothetical protein
MLMSFSIVEDGKFVGKFFEMFENWREDLYR